MKKTIQFNEKCRQCIYYEILNSDGYVLNEDECSKLQLDEKSLKSVLRDAGISNIRIV